jgi:hypothetical protein
MRQTTTLVLSLLAVQIAYAQQDPSTPSTTDPGSAPPSTAAPAPAPIPAPPAEEPTPFIFGIRQGLTGNSNVFRAPDGSPEVRRDRIWTSGLHLGLDKSLGRQHFLLDLQANYNKYNKNTQLTNTDYSGTARWDWQTVERISGELTAQQRQSLYRDTINGVISTERNELRTTSLGFQARVGLITRWSFEAGVAASENDYRGTSVQNRDVRQTIVNGGIRYRPSDVLSTRVSLRRGEGSYPNIAGIEDEFTRDDVDFITNWTASGASRLDTRLSATRERHTLQGQRNSRGWTGGIGWAWRPTGKISTDLDLSSDRSVGRTGFDSSLVSAESSEAREAQTAALSVVYAATAKISITPRASYVRRKLDNSFTTGGTGDVQATDRTVVGAIGLTYTPTQALMLTCEISREQRTVSGAPGLTTPYSMTVAGCTGELAIR